VNDELGALTEGIQAGFARMQHGGRMAVISFHSLEDRIVKRFFKEKAELGEGHSLTKKPIVPSDEEMKNNRRARSAKLRIIEKK
jgi:16S rRNA (cytosine1402-N4)-methyltransferase